MSTFLLLLLALMTLVEQIVANLEVEPGQAEKGIGAILMAMRMAVDKATFEKVRVAVPNHESYMGRALMSGARTGEMIGVAGPPPLIAGGSPPRVFQEKGAPLGPGLAGGHSAPPRQPTDQEVPARPPPPQEQ